MSEQPRLHLDVSSWPRWLKVSGFLVVFGLLLGMFFAPSPLYQPILFLYIFGQMLERFWKRQKVGFITRADDPHAFWGLMSCWAAIFAFWFFLLIDALNQVLSTL